MKFDPDSNQVKLQFQSSWDLSFVIGAFLGDGSCVEDSDYHHHVKLAVRDRDFANAFNQSVAVVLGRKPNVITVSRYSGKVYYESKYSSRPLGLFLERPLEELRSTLAVHPAAFLRGLFSADGCAAVSFVRNGLRVAAILSNSNLKLLIMVETILQSCFRIHSKIYLSRRKGASWKNGVKTVTLRKDAYQLRIQRAHDVKAFAARIGFQIRRKQETIMRAIQLTEALGSINAAKVWRSQQFPRQAPLETVAER